MYSPESMPSESVFESVTEAVPSSNPVKRGETSSRKDAALKVSVVLDASTALAAVLPDEQSAFARAATAAAVREGLIVPVLWAYEIQNGLATALRRERIDAESLGEALEALRGLGAELEAPQGLGHELRLAQTHGLTAYDAAYLAVALSTGATLATNDLQLRRVAATVGIALFAASPSKPNKAPRKRR